jgi:penicillin amidase
MRPFLPFVLLLALLTLLHALPSAAQETAASLQKKAKAVLAQDEGEIAIPGLKEPVEVLRDRWGVPHIYAKNADDLFFAQGFVAAQDRLFQLDLWRRVAVGEMAEIQGKSALEGDRFARLVRYRGDMEKEWASYSPDTRQIATAFTRGINAYIDHLGKRLPVEFEILGYAPKKWQPEDILGRMSGIIMTRNFQTEVFRSQLVAAVGLKKARVIAPTDPIKAYQPPDELDLNGIDSAVLASYRAATRPLLFKPPLTESNNWVVAGARSTSGKPLLASDPHRAIALPALRYLVHLHAPGWNVIGSGEPGLPGVAIGHNERIAWGYTIVGTDQADLYVEETRPDDPTQYKVGDKWERMTVVREAIPVKGQPKPVEVELRYTRHGPVIHQDAKRSRAVALKWVGSEPGTAAYLGSLAVGRANNWQEFQQALKAWKSPSENFVYADVEGNIGWVATALSPVRKGWDGLFPVPGASGKYEWQGYLDVKDLPQTFNPAAGYVATANHNILPPGYKYEIAYNWAAPYRYQRVKHGLEAKKQFTLDDFKKIQHDTVSIPGQTLAQLAKMMDLQEPSLDPYVKLMADWDGDLSRASRAGPLYAVWLQELQDDFYAPHIPKNLTEQVRSLSSVSVMLEALEKADPAWFGESGRSERDRLLRATFSRAVRKVQKLLGVNAVDWKWEKLHSVTFRHPLSTLGPAYEKAFNLGPVGRGGDTHTPNNTGYNPKFEQITGATYRHLFDLADWDRGLATSAPGQSGQPGSPHYGDLLPLWAEGEYFPLAFSRAKVEEVTRHRLLLKPTTK